LRYDKEMVRRLGSTHTPKTRVQTAYWPFYGGVNITSPALTKKAGECYIAVNHEAALPTGYHRIDGYERYDGQTRPSDSRYYLLYFDTGSVAPVVGNIITDGVGTGELILAPVVESGSWGGGDAAGYYVLLNVVDPTAFQNGDSLTPGTSLATGEAQIEASYDDALHTTYKDLATEIQRAKIDEVPGEGPVRGVWMLNEERVAFRNKVGGATAGMYKATATGWVEITVSPYWMIPYTSGDGTQPVADDTLTLVRSAADVGTGNILAVTVDSGTWAGSDAEGFIIVDQITGSYNFASGLTFDVDTGGSGTISGVVKANDADDGGDHTTWSTAAETLTLAPGGHYDFENHNFYGHDETYAMYWANSVDYAYTYDGRAVAPIYTGMVADTPTHINAFKKHLVLSFSGGSLQFSSLGEPLSWDPLLGAAEFGVGHDITGLVVESANVLGVYTEKNVYSLQGTTIGNFDLKQFNESTGGIRWTIQKVDLTWLLTSRGLVTTRTTEQFGDFRQATVSEKAHKWWTARLRNVRCSLICRTKNQYRIFFSGSNAQAAAPALGDGMFVTFDNNRVIGSMPIQYQIAPFCAESVDSPTDGEQMLCGAEDGFVYQLDSGNSFDGGAVRAVLTTIHHHYDSPQMNKRFRGIEFELDTEDLAEIQMVPDYSYGSDEIPRARTYDIGVKGAGGLWDNSLWDTFLWSGQYITTGRNRIDGLGNNMALTLFSEMTHKPPYTFQGAVVSYSERRLIR